MDLLLQVCVFLANFQPYFYQMSSNKNYILSAATAESKLRRMALEVTERNYDETDLILVGIKESGSVIAAKIAHYLKMGFAGNIISATIKMDKTKPETAALSPALDLTNKTVLLIDDVANSGRTMLYAMQPLLIGNPKSIQTLALVERSHKSYPVALDYVGISFSTTLQQHIFVETSTDGVEGAWMYADE
jgi:pyrimidine operon attenuation protein / uracil phosphoribosyltransferase